METRGLPKHHPQQHAFIPGVSIDEALSKATTIIENGLHNKQYTMGVFLDMSGAFNNVEIDACIEGFAKSKLPPTTTRWLTELLRNREVTAEINGLRQTRVVNRGTPQGGVWSPKIWNMAIDELLEMAHDPGGKIGRAHV